MKALESERLRLRPFTNEDVEIHGVVFSDPEVCRYYCGETRTLERVREWLVHRRWQARSDDELGFLAVVRKEDDQILGLVALQLCVAPWLVLEEAPESPFHPLIIELSYAFGRGYQRKGYATEACRALMEYGFKELRIPVSSTASFRRTNVRFAWSSGSDFAGRKTSTPKKVDPSGFGITICWATVDRKQV